MIKHILNIALLLIPLIGFSQEHKEKIWEQEKEYLKYEKKNKYKGPDDWYGDSPSDIKEDEIFSGGGGTYGGSYGSGGIKYSPQQIQQDRSNRHQGFDRGGGSGTLKFDPKVERPDPIEIPDIDAPDVDLPDIDIDIDTPSISPGVWKFLLFLLIFAAVLTIAYLIIKNKKPSNKKVVVNVENDWNPEVISKTDLELRLEAAIEKEDYREAVRVYFTFILKALIKKGWISWKKEKTNHHYVIEMSKHPNTLLFMSCVRIYDLVWYGEYNIDKEIFDLLKPELETYYKTLSGE